MQNCKYGELSSRSDRGTVITDTVPQRRSSRIARIYDTTTVVGDNRNKDPICAHELTEITACPVSFFSRTYCPCILKIVRDEVY